MIFVSVLSSPKLFWNSMTILGPKLSNKSDYEFFSWVGLGIIVNLFIAGILYRRHLSTTNTFLRKVWNDGQTLTTKHLCSGHLSIAGIIFKSELLLPPRTDLSIAGTPNNRPYKTFLVIHFHAIYFRQCFRLLHFVVLFLS